MSNDGSIKIAIEVDGKEVKVASKELDNLEESGHKVGKGVKAAESSVDSLADSSAKASKNVKGAADSVDGLADSGSKASKDLKGADGAIDGVAGSSAQAASSVKGVGDSLDGMSDKASQAASSADQVKQSTDGIGEGSAKASIGMKDLAVSLGLVAVASAAFDTLKSSLDGAISRFDTLNRFPKVLQSLGVSAEESEQAISRLSDGIEGLPTTLDDITGSVQELYTSFDDIDIATETALALNNALLGSGASAEQASRGTQQYTKALQTGVVHMDTWNTLSETMGVGLIKVAEEFGYAGKSAKQDLYAALQDGTVTMDQFNAKLIEVGTGTGIMAELAKENSLGIATSLGNLRNAAARGIADIIASFDKLSKEVTGKDLAQNIDALKHVVNASFKTMGSVIEGTAPVFVFFGSTVKAVIPVVEALTPAIIGLMAAYGAYIVVSKAHAAIEASNKILIAAKASQEAMTIAITASTAAQARQTGAVTLSNVAIGLLSRQMTWATARTAVYTTATYALAAAKKFLMGPIGWITAGVGLLVAGFITVTKVMGEVSEEAQEMRNKLDAINEEIGELTTSIEDSSKAYKENQKDIEVTSNLYSDLVNEVARLSEIENKSTHDKTALKNTVDQLNASMEGLNLTYDSQADALSLTTEELHKKHEIFSAMAEQEADQRRLNEVLEERNEIEMKIKELIPIYEEAEAAYKSGENAQKGQINVMQETEEQIEVLKEAMGGLNEEEERIAQAMIERQGLLAQAVEDGTLRQVIAFQDLNDNQKEIIESLKGQYDDLWQRATEAFEKMDATSKHTMDSMQGNLEHNQSVMANYSENVQKLLEWAGEHGYRDFISWMEMLGPDAAGEIAVLAAASEPELEKFAKTMESGSEIAMDGTKAKLGEGMDDVVDFMVEQLGDLPTTMREIIEGGQFEEVGISVGEGFGKGVEESADVPVKAAGEMAQDTIDEAKDVLGTNSPSKEFTTIGESAPEGMTLGITNGTPEVISAAKKLATELLKPFDRTPADFEQIGNEAMAGFKRGLDAGKGQVLATAKSIADQAAQTMRKALDIHSPSRVMIAIGEDTMEGNAVGIENKTKRNVQAVEGVAKAVKKASEKASKELADAKTDAQNKEQEIEKKRNEDIRKKRAQYQDARKKNIQNHNAEIRRINEQANKRLQEQRKKNASDLANLEERHIKERLDTIKMYIQEKKSLNELSLIDEVYIWKEQISLFKQGTKERIEAQSAYKKSIEDVNKQVLDINEKYGKKMQDVNKNLADEEDRIWDEFVQKREQRFKDIAGFASLFDEFEIDPQDNGEELLENLQGQVDGLEKWMDTIEQVSNRLTNADLIAELQGLGPKALGELMALNQLTDEQLSEYEELYWKKFALARVQAGEETKGMRDDVFDSIDAMRETANEELEVLKDEWLEAMRDLTGRTDKELQSLEQIGIDAGKGLDQGLASMKPTLIATATNIAQAIKDAMASVLGIHSPSTVMRDEVGRWIPAGVAVGIRENAKTVYDELERMAGNMIIPSSPEIALGTSKMAYSGGLLDSTKNISTSTDNRKMFSPHIENYFTKEESSPAESTRKQDQMLKRLGLGF